MTDESTTPTDGGAPAPIAGERLAEARRARNVSIGEIARQLHLDEPKVRALEQNAFDLLGAPVFAKGYLRKYAQAVGMSADDILADYYRLNRATAAPPLIGRRMRPPRDVSPGPWIGAAMVLIVVAGAAWWWFSRGSEWLDNGTEPGTLSPVAGDRSVEQLRQGDEGQSQAAVEAEPGPADGPGGDSTDSGSAPADLPVSGLDQPRVEQPATRQPATRQPGVQRPTTGGDEVELRMTFSGDCWTEVTDAAGQRLYFGLGTAGRAVTVAGEPPLQVLLGDSDNATLSVNGERYPVPPSARRGDTARMTITGR